jgi:tetratricopeptide (TPR) repeat protein
MKFIEKYLVILLGILAFLLYTNTIGHDYAWDDQLVITQNPITTEGISGIVDIWTNDDYIIQRPTYRPVPQTLYAVVWEFFPNKPNIAHIINIILYSLCVMAFFNLLLSLFPKVSKLVLGLVCLFFLLMPIHVEVVANIKSGDEILSALFTILSLIYAQKNQEKFKFFALALFTLAILSKISAVTITPIFLYFWIKDFQFLTHVRNELESQITIIEFFVIIALFYILSVTPIYNLLLFPILLLIFVLNLNINDKSPINLLKIVLGIALTKYFLGSEVATIIGLMWFYHLSNKSFSKTNYALLFVIAITVISAISSFKEFQLLILVVAYIYTLNQLSKTDKFQLKNIAFPLVFSILYVVLIFFSDEPITKQTLLSTLSSFIFVLSPILIFILFKYIPRMALIVLFFLAFFMYFSKKNVEIYTSLQENKNLVFIKKIEGEKDYSIIYNEPYHNILVTASNNSVKFATIARIQLVYLQKLVFPTQLIHQHGTQQIGLASWSDWDVYVSILIHLILLFLIYFFFKRKEYWIAGGFIWYLLSISIYTNIIRLMPDTLAERFLFLPSLGFAVAFVGSIYYFVSLYFKAENKSLLVSTLLLVPIFLYFTFKTINRNTDWKNNYTLAANTLPFAQNNAAINAQYALELNNLMKYKVIPVSDSAKTLVVSHYKKALEIFPNFYGPNADLANYYIIEAKPDSAYSYLIEASRLMPKEWLHHYYLGLIHFERNKYNDALNNFQTLIADSTLQSRAFEFPELLEAYEYSARCYHNTGKDPQAYAILEEAIKIFNQKSSYILLGNLYRVTGKQKEAIAVFERLLVYNPNDQELINTIQYLKQGLIY